MPRRLSSIRHRRRLSMRCHRHRSSMRHRRRLSMRCHRHRSSMRHRRRLSMRHRRRLSMRHHRRRLSMRHHRHRSFVRRQRRSTRRCAEIPDDRHAPSRHQGVRPALKAHWGATSRGFQPSATPSANGRSLRIAAGRLELADTEAAPFSCLPSIVSSLCRCRQRSVASGQFGERGDLAGRRREPSCATPR